MNENEWLPASEAFPAWKIGTWFEMEYAPAYRFEKSARTMARRWAMGSNREQTKVWWSWVGFTNMGASSLVKTLDVECRVRLCDPPRNQ